MLKMSLKFVIFTDVSFQWEMVDKRDRQWL